ncbi:unnamed protein product [Rhizoctonia solani]|uniref:RRM domain-containing protein n=1 Tax=Rhizoctonia solani TaxID=456999 RepID=A0A8H3E387_9AGAM|nr:unnamed protein product [Rhizoctonia solani]
MAASRDEDMRSASRSRSRGRSRSGTRSSRSRSPSTRTVLVKHLTRNIVNGHLRAVFSPYGEIRKIYMPTHQKSGQTRGSAHIEFYDSQAAKTAVTHMHTGLLDGATLAVELSDPPRSPSPPRLGARCLPLVAARHQGDTEETRTAHVHFRVVEAGVRTGAGGHSVGAEVLVAAAGAAHLPALRTHAQLQAGLGHARDLPLARTPVLLLAAQVGAKAGLALHSLVEKSRNFDHCSIYSRISVVL